jgi:hypothetical protein
MACEQGNHYALGEDKARIQARENSSHGLFYGESGVHTCFLARKLNDTICAKNLYSIGIEILPQRAVLMRRRRGVCFRCDSGALAEKRTVLEHLREQTFFGNAALKWGVRISRARAIAPDTTCKVICFL